jgi:hypothetical protein
MGQRRKSGVTRDTHAERALRDQEVLRANRELAAYFKGQRTEREARAALKTIKAFVRDRERLDAASRPPLPGLAAPKASREPATRKSGSVHAKRTGRKSHRAVVLRSVKSKNLVSTAEPDAAAEMTPIPPSGETSSE